MSERPEQIDKYNYHLATGTMAQVALLFNGNPDKPKPVKKRNFIRWKTAILFGDPRKKKRP